MNPDQSTHDEGSPDPVPTLSADVLHASGKVLFRSVFSCLLLVSPAGRIRFANKAAEHLIGSTSEDLYDVQMETLFEPEEDPDDPNVRARQQNYASGAATILSQPVKVRLRNGTTLPARIHLSPVPDHAGTIIGHVVTIEDRSDFVQMSHFVEMVAHHDLQTGIPKMETILREVDAAILNLHGSGMSFALVGIGIDHFRRINESLGHDAGNVALREIGRRLSETLESHDVLTRSSGDGFVVLFNNCPTQAEAMRRATNLLRTFSEPFRIGDYCVRITASFGMSYCKGGSVTQKSSFTECELALRRSKSMGGNQVVCFEPDMADWHSMAVQMESDMRLALTHGEFFVVYQPQICLKTGKLMGVEALMRWNSPTKGLIVPNSFIPLAEETGLIVQMGEWCLRTACAEVASMQKRLGQPITLAVNVSPKQARDKAFREVVQSALESSGLQPSSLEVEITEGLLISHEDEALRLIADLQEMGVSVAMDDFGMGFSNLSYITRFRVDRLKIDRSFVARCTEDQSSRMITTSILFLAKSLGIEVVAEGVETEEQAAMLADLECEVAQGFLYSRPTTAEEICRRSGKFASPRPPAKAAEIKLAPLSTGSAKSTAASLFAKILSPSEPAKPSGKAATAAVLSMAAAGAHGLDPIEPREPLCRPAHPARKPGAARVSYTIEEEGDTITENAESAVKVPQFRLL